MYVKNNKYQEHAIVYSTYVNRKKGMVLVRSLFAPLYVIFKQQQMSRTRIVYSTYHNVREGLVFEYALFALWKVSFIWLLYWSLWYGSFLWLSCSILCEGSCIGLMCMPLLHDLFTGWWLVRSDSNYRAPFRNHCLWESCWGWQLMNTSKQNKKE